MSGPTRGKENSVLHRILISVLGTFVAGAQAQEAPAPPTPPAPPVMAHLAGLPGLPGEDVLMFVSSELGGRGVVKGAPYSATAVSETRQTLTDGNRIVRSSTAKLYRDAQGRTRQEQGKDVVFINDVVAGKRFVLNSDRKTARELPAVRTPLTPPVPPVPGAAPVPPAPPAPPQMSSEEARSWAEEMRQWAREFSSRMRGESTVIESEVAVQKEKGEAAAGARPEIVNERVEVIRLGRGTHTPVPPLPPTLPLMAPPGPGAKTSLGARDFDGVRADGTKTTWTIPAGQIGNEKPIEIVAERWYSPDLMLVVYSRHADPRTGERIYRLEGIRRDEPPVDLFKAPADYETRPGAKSERK